ncbi:hypothetical protein OAS12_01525 [Candidatus Pelagibacter ubique]|nr:hypothetical protein [Candidatus Pelagibacter ubique]
MSIIDKLDKKISDKKIKNKLKEEEEKLEAKRIKKLFKSIQDFCTEVYKKHLAYDFKRLEKLFVKHSQNQRAIEIYFVDDGLLSDLRIALKYDITESYSREIKIQFEHKDKKGVSRYSDDLKSMNSYKYLDTNLCLRVYPNIDYSNDYKEFELKDKEKAYEYFADLFQKEIWERGEITGVIK